MRSMFKRWVFGAIAVAAVVLLIGCPDTTPVTVQATAELADMEFAAGATTAKTVDLSKYFSTSRENLKFSAVPSDKAVADASVSGNTLTVTPKGPGTATVTVTADDGKSTRSQTIVVMVMKPAPTPKPTITPPIPQVDFDSMGSDAQTVMLGDYFSGTGITYSVASNSMESVATAAVAGDMLTITPVAVGQTVIKVTATNAGGSVSQNIVVVVGEPDELPIAQPMSIGNFAAQTFGHDDMEARMFMLDMYFSGATSYTPESSDPDVVMASESDGMLTVTPVGAGMASVKVTATSDDTRALAISLTMDVEVDAPPAPPALRADMSFMALKMVAVDVTATADVDETIKALDLDTYFHDPDGFTLVYSTMTDDAEKVAVYKTPGTGEDAPTDLNAAAKAAGSMVTIKARAIGSATITITATDATGLSREETFMVTVAANSGPTTGGDKDPLPNSLLTEFMGDDRLKSDAATKTVMIDFNDHVMDADVLMVGSSDMLTFMASPADEDVVSVSLSPTGAAGKPWEYNVMITPEGPGTSVVTLKATDTFGLEADPPLSFTVQVNNRPMAYGAQAVEADRMSLEDVDTYKGVAIGQTLADLELVADAGGYFSDADASELLKCRFVSEGDAATVTWDGGETGDRNTLAIVAAKLGTTTVDVSCFDQVGGENLEESDVATLTITVTFSGSVQG